MSEINIIPTSSDKKPGRPSIEPNEKKITKNFIIKRKIIDGYLAYCSKYGKDHNQLVEDYLASIIEAKDEDEAKRILMDKIKFQIEELTMQYSKLAGKVVEIDRFKVESATNEQNPAYLEWFERQVQRFVNDPTKLQYLPETANIVFQDYKINREAFIKAIKERVAAESQGVDIQKYLPKD